MVSADHDYVSVGIHNPMQSCWKGYGEIEVNNKTVLFKQVGNISKVAFVNQDWTAENDNRWAEARISTWFAAL